MKLAAVQCYIHLAKKTRIEDPENSLPDFPSVLCLLLATGNTREAWCRPLPSVLSSSWLPSICLCNVHMGYSGLETPGDLKKDHKILTPWLLISVPGQALGAYNLPSLFFCSQQEGEAVALSPVPWGCEKGILDSHCPLLVWSSVFKDEASAVARIHVLTMPPVSGLISSAVNTAS